MAPDIDAPDASLTSPKILAVGSCAIEGMTARKTKPSKHAIFRTLMVMRLGFRQICLFIGLSSGRISDKAPRSYRFPWARLPRLACTKLPETSRVVSLVKTTVKRPRLTAPRHFVHQANVAH